MNANTETTNLTQDELQYIYSLAWDASQLIGLARMAAEDQVPERYMDKEEALQVGLEQSFALMQDILTTVHTKADDLNLEILPPLEYRKNKLK